MKPVKTAPLVHKCMIAGLKQKMFGTPIPDIRVLEDALGHHLHLVVTEQEDIGWIHALKVRISMRWRVAQQQYYYEWLHGVKHRNADRWSMLSICGLWRIYDSLWKAHNDILYKKHSITTAAMHEQVRLYYSNPHDFIMQQDLVLFHRPMTDLLSLSPTAMHYWLQTVGIVKTQQTRRLNEQDIATYFPQMANDNHDADDEASLYAPIPGAADLSSVDSATYDGSDSDNSSMASFARSLPSIDEPGDTARRIQEGNAFPGSPPG